ncbi:hypothetical protein [Geobacter sp. AOG2]|uniref:hypothetical protein n=1 Tax=Geobacter sp. AOG2 TaxID=1566347 RepID=UPI001CC6DD0F|nr:hypothetical protein [Geobacter sp. AOG2]GFE62318.1 hypothetical protein AOG2_29060 [Geobacter sp. AOG2]
MDLTLDEQRLVAEYRRLTPAGRDELLACAATLVRQTNAEKDGGTATDQCRLKSTEPHPEAEKTPFFTE